MNVKTLIFRSPLYSSTIIEEFKTPNNVTFIGSSIFKGITTLKTVKLSDSVTTISSSCFYGCTKLISINLANVTDVYGEAFANCSSLTSIDLGKVTAFDGQTDSGIDGYCAAFVNCTNLKDVELSSSLKYLGAYMFKNCTSLESITLPSSLGLIEPHTFEGCSSLATIDLSYVTKFGESALYGTAIGNDVLENLNTSVTELPSHIFYNCSNITKFVIPANITTIGSRILSYTNIEELTIPATVTTLSDGCVGQFANIPVKTLTIDAGSPLTYWPLQFINGMEITEIELPVALESLGYASLNALRYLETIIVRNTTKVINFPDDVDDGNAFGKSSVEYGNNCAGSLVEGDKVLYVPAQLVDAYQADTTDGQTLADDGSNKNYWKTVLIDICKFKVVGLDENGNIPN
ncbi:MAG: leucine-rich repeat domain-containing protein [Rikenellaceae bacterium]